MTPTTTALEAALEDYAQAAYERGYDDGFRVRGVHQRNAHADLVAALKRVRLAVDGSGEISHQEARRIIDAALEEPR